MAVAKNKIESANSRKPKRAGRIFTRIIFFFTAFLLFLVLLVSVTQTRPFKNFVSGYVVDKINESFAEKDSKLTINSLDGNFFSEIVLTGATLHVKNDDMVTFDRLKISFDIFQLLNKKINLKEVVLQNPSANFVKVRNTKGDSVWNFAYLFSSDKEKDTEKTDFEWKINIERLRIENLNLVMLGAKSSDLPVGALKISDSKNLDIENLKITNFTIETSVYYDKNSAQLQIGHLAFNSNFGFDLQGLSGNFFISKSRAEVNKLNIETARSWIQMDYVFIDKLDLMNIEGLPSFKGKDMRLHMIARTFDFDDLKAFLEPLSFLDGKVFCELKCDGKFDNMNIERCAVRTENSDMNFHGRMVNLIDPEHLSFDIAGENLTMDPADTKIHVPGLPIPDYSYLGKVHGSFTYKGEPLNFQTTYDIQSSAGDAKGNFSMNLTTPAIDYSGYVETRGGNIGKVIRDEKLESNLNGKVEFKGSGFTLANIHTHLSYELTASKFSEYSWESTSGTIDLNNYNIGLDVKYLSRDINTQVAGTMNVADFNNPHYNLKGKVLNFNAAAFTKNPQDKSNLSFDFDVNGSGISPESLEGTYHINLAKSYYGKYDFLATPIDLQVSTGGAESFVTMKSNLVDMEARGKFKLAEVGDLIVSNLTMMQNEISKKFDLDTLLPVRETKIVSNDADFKYKITTKNADAIARMLYFEDVNFAGDISGYFRNNEKNFESRSSINIKNFTYGDSLVVINDANLDLFLNNDYAKYTASPKGDFSSFTSDIGFKTDKLILNKAVYDSIGVDLNLANGVQYFKAAFKLDTAVKTNISGNVDMRADTITLRIDELLATYAVKYLKNDDTLIVSYNPYSDSKKLDINNFQISGDFLTINLGGYYAIAGESDLYAEMSNVSIPALSELSLNPNIKHDRDKKDDEYKSPLKGNIRRILLGFKGTMQDPKLSLEMNTGLIRYENTKIGRVDAFIDYAENKLSTDVLVSNSLGQGSLRLTGDTPFSNPLAEPDSSSYYSVISNPLNLKLKAKDFQINFFSKLIPNFAEVKGFLNGEISSAGTIAEPQLTGGMNIDKGRFFLEINNLYYRFNASLRAENSDLIVDNFSIYYIDDDRRHLDAFGKINFAGLRLNDIDLTTSGDVKVLDRSSRLNRFGFYGDLIAGSGTPAITIKGDLNRLYISGQLVAKDGNLLFPSIQGLEYNIYADDFIYRIIDDSTGGRYLDTVVVVEKDNLDEIDPFLKYKYELANKPSSIADNLIFNLNVVTAKSIYASINFNELTREELFGEIRADINIQNEYRKDFQFFGNMDIVGDSYYRMYYKNFKIENSSLNFDGPYDNPLLNIKAKYKNIRTDANGEQEIRYVVLTISGTRYKPQLAFRLEDENGIAITGQDESSNAFSYLLFGVSMKDVNSTNVRTDILNNLGSNVLSNVTSSYLSSLVREVAPFILNTEVNYWGGNIAQGTDIRITSEIGGALVRFGGKILNNINNAEVTVQYPLNKLLDINVSNNLLLEIKRELKTNSDFSNTNSIEYGVGLTYKINF